MTQAPDDRFTWIKPLVGAAAALGAGAAAVASFWNSYDSTGARSSTLNPTARIEDRQEALAARLHQIELWQAGHEQFSTQRSEELTRSLDAIRTEAALLRQELDALRARQDRVIDRLNDVETHRR